MPDPLMPAYETEKEKQLRQALYKIIGIWPNADSMREAAHQGLDNAYPEQKPVKNAR